MARNRIHIDAEPERVFAALGTPDRYPQWVVGAREIRDADDGFPQAGTRFHHEVGSVPATLSDHTEVLRSEPPRRLVLKAKARPFGTARIEFELSAGKRGGTDVLMEEGPGDRLTALVAGNRLADTALRLRNAESLSRLKRLVEERPAVRAPKVRDLRGQRVLITGGSSGIGLACAEQLAAAGARVALLGRSEEGLQAAADRVAAHGERPLTVAADVRDREALAGAMAEATKGLGGLDVLIAGAVGAAFGHFVDTPAEDFDATIATVLTGTANAIREALPELERSGGAVVAIGSIAARMPLPGLSAYTAAKHGLVGLLWTLRAELAETGSPVTLSLVNPGAVDTPLWSRLESATGLLPPAPPALYTAADVAEVVTDIVRRPREEIVVGGFARSQIAFASHLGRAANGALKILDRFFQSGGDRRAGRNGALYSGMGAGEVDGGFGGRPSLAVLALRSRRGRRARSRSRPG